MEMLIVIRPSRDYTCQVYRLILAVFFYEMKEVIYIAI